jgi:fatty acid desaturase
MADYPFEPIEVAWKRPPVDKEILRRFAKRSDLNAWLHCLGTLAILGASGAVVYWLYTIEEWVWMGVALYVHGALFAFNPQLHELSHGTVFRTKWLNRAWGRVFGLLHWTSNAALYKMSHAYHHQYTLHRKSEGEEVHPRAEMADEVVKSAFLVVDVTGAALALYDAVVALFVPFLRNPRRNTWLRYAYSRSDARAQRDVYWTGVSQLMFHLLFAVAAVASGHWFLVVIVTLPQFYGGRWYHLWVHDTMHVGREPESDDFRKCCRSVKVNPVTSFLFWHMEWHTEHHTFAGVPCYNLRRFHRATRGHWDAPQSLVQAWREMGEHSRKLLALQGAR